LTGRCSRPVVHYCTLPSPRVTQAFFDEKRLRPFLPVYVSLIRFDMSEPNTPARPIQRMVLHPLPLMGQNGESAHTASLMPPCYSLFELCCLGLTSRGAVLQFLKGRPPIPSPSRIDTVGGPPRFPPAVPHAGSLGRAIGADLAFAQWSDGRLTDTRSRGRTSMRIRTENGEVRSCLGRLGRRLSNLG
jgi:hypothetical protein